jgi:hypothetical protein
LFAILGGLIVGVGLYIRTDSNWAPFFDNPEYGFNLLYFIIGIGGLMAWTALFGFCGAYTTKHCCIRAYVKFLVICVIIQAVSCYFFFEFNEGLDGLENSISSGKLNLTTTGTKYEQKLNLHLRATATHIYVQGNCTVISDSSKEPRSLLDWDDLSLNDFTEISESEEAV